MSDFFFLLIDDLLVVKTILEQPTAVGLKFFERMRMLSILLGFHF